MKTVDRLIVEHIIIQLNTPNREVERILMNSPTLLNFAANTILTRNMSFLFLEKGITHFRKNHTMIKKLVLGKKSNGLNLTISLLFPNGN